MKTYPPHHHEQSPPWFTCPICGQTGVTAYMIEHGAVIEKRYLRKRFRHLFSWRGNT